MLWFMALLSFSVSLATKCVSLNNDPCTIRLTLIGLHPVELSYCPFMVSSDTFSGICNPVDDLSVKAFVPGKIKDINVKAFNILTSKNEAKTYKMDYHILHAVLLVIILLFIITIICYHYAKHRSKLKKILPC